MIRIDKGRFGDVDLSGLFAAMLYAWPGPIYKGNGEIQAIIDERASDEQRHALKTVLYGGETEEAATHWWVYHAMASQVHEPLSRKLTSKWTSTLEQQTSESLVCCNQVVSQ